MRGGFLVPVLCLGAMLLAACAERETPADAAAAADRPDQETWDVDFDIEIDGQRRARLAAAYAARFERQDSTFARFGPGATTRRVRVVVFGEDGQRSATVEADHLDYLEEARKFVATGDVVVLSESGRRLEGERLIWDEAARQIRSDGFVSITTATEKLQGYRLVADESLDTYRLARITGQVEVDDQ
jgi:LPS export ABC transporter protein LptC